MTLSVKVLLAITTLRGRANAEDDGMKALTTSNHCKTCLKLATIF
jgi:hypothetical protein